MKTNIIYNFACPVYQIKCQDDFCYWGVVRLMLSK